MVCNMYNIWGTFVCVSLTIRLGYVNKKCVLFGSYKFLKQ